MAKIANATFNGQKDKYRFEVYPTNTTFSAVGAVYIFTKRVVDPSGSGKGTHTLLYIGETESLVERIPNHEKWDCVTPLGANCICVHRDDNQQSRAAKETDLLAANTTPCNDQ